jgi:hypothetical protein
VTKEGTVIPEIHDELSGIQFGTNDGYRIIFMFQLI